MKQAANSTNKHPMIVKMVQQDWTGVQSHNMLRHCIGYIVHGHKYIYDGDSRKEVGPGEIFCLGSGNHYMENIPENKKPFEQITIYYSPELLSRMIINLSLEYGLEIENDNGCEECTSQSNMAFAASKAIRTFFGTIEQYIHDGIISSDETVQSLKMQELVYMIMTGDDCCLKRKLLRDTDPNKDSFEHIIQQNIFSDVTIESLARQCNRSMTSFKQEFKKYYAEPPHKWLIKQRLMHSRVLLISGTKSVSEIGNECNFPNTSHFIKLFKKEYGMTPSSYRNANAPGKNIEARKRGPRSKKI